MQGHRSWRNRAETLAARLTGYAEDRFYGGLAGSEITFDPSEPRSNPFVRGYTRSRWHGLTVKGRPDPAESWEDSRAA